MPRGMSKSGKSRAETVISSQSAKRAHFGLGTAKRVDSVEVHWPSGIIDNIKVSINRRYVVEERKGLIPDKGHP